MRTIKKLQLQICGAKSEISRSLFFQEVSKLGSDRKYQVQNICQMHKV